MKLFKFVNRKEGAFPKGAILIVGKSFSHLGYDGWFIKLEIPLTFNTMFTNHVDFSEKYGPCRLVRAWIFRKNRKIISIKATVPQ